MKRKFVTDKENQELIEKMKRNIKITDYARQRGYTVIPSGNRYYSLKEHPSVRIDDHKNCFWRNSCGRSGSVIDFVMHFHDNHDDYNDVLTKHEALSILTDMAGYQNYHDIPIKPIIKSRPESEQKTVKGDLILPERNHNLSNVYAYLIQTRKLSPSIVSSLIAKKMIYQDKNKNCVFVGYNDVQKPVFCTLRGTNTYQRYVRDFTENDYGYGLYLNHGSDTLIASESVISGLSLATIMEKQQKPIGAYNHLFLGGVNKLESLYYHDFNHNIKKIVLAFDNDRAGLAAIDKAVNQLKERGFQGDVIPFTPKKEGYDWNDYLCELVQNHEKTAAMQKSMER